MADFEDAISLTLKREGGFADLKNDPGGVTNFGISLRFLKALDPKATAVTIKDLTVESAKKIYLNEFWLPNKYGKIDSQKVANKVFDLSVNCGSHMANQFIQKSVNLLNYSDPLIVDGNIGPASIAAINLCHPEALHACIKYNAIGYYIAIIEKNKNLSAFKKGWFNRCCADD